MPAVIGAGREFAEQTRLPDTGLSRHGDCRRLSRLEFDEELIKRAELLGAPDELLGKKGHFVSATSIEQCPWAT